MRVAASAICPQQRCVVEAAAVLFPSARGRERGGILVLVILQGLNRDGKSDDKLCTHVMVVAMR